MEDTIVINNIEDLKEFNEISKKALEEYKTLEYKKQTIEMDISACLNEISTRALHLGKTIKNKVEIIKYVNKYKKLSVKSHMAYKEYMRLYDEYVKEKWGGKQIVYFYHEKSHKNFKTYIELWSSGTPFDIINYNYILRPNDIVNIENEDGDWIRSRILTSYGCEWGYVTVVTGTPKIDENNVVYVRLND